MALTPDQLDRLALQYADAWGLLLDGTDTAVRDLWLAYGGVSDQAAAAWAAAAEPLITGAQATAAAQAAGWLDVQMANIGVEALPPSAAPVLEAPTMLLEQPIVRARALAATGMDYGLVMDQAGQYVGRLASTMVRAAEQDGRAQRARAVRTDVPDGYRAIAGGRLRLDKRSPLLYARVPGSRACGWCLVVADRPYSEQGVAGSWHAFCDCTWRVATPEDFGRMGQFADGAWRDVPGMDRSARRSTIQDGVDTAEAKADYWRQRARDTDDPIAESRYAKRADAWQAKADTRRTRLGDTGTAQEAVQDAAAALPTPGQFPAHVRTTPDALAWMREAHPGLDLRDLPDDWPDETMVPAMRRLDALATEYPEVASGLSVRPRPPVDQVPEDLRTASAWYDPRDHSITLGPMYQDVDLAERTALAGRKPFTDEQRAWYAKRGSYMGDDGPFYGNVAASPERTLTHEFGHAVDYRYRARITSIGTDLSGNNGVAVLNGIGWVDTSAPRGTLARLVHDMDTDLMTTSRTLSLYAQHNRSEAFAEAFAAMYHLPGGDSLPSSVALRRYLTLGTPGAVPITFAPRLDVDASMAALSRLGAQHGSIAAFLRTQDAAAASVYRALGLAT